jgi:uncharacterized protein (TIGR01370 family)
VSRVSARRRRSHDRRQAPIGQACVTAWIAALAVIASCIGAAPAGAAPSAKLTEAKSFSLALGAKLSSRNIRRLAARDLVVVDGEAVTPTQITQLKRKGALVLGYLSVGTVESWRSWFEQLQAYRLEPLADWPGERYADVSQPAARAALADAITPMLLGKGFDGLFLDNVDMVEDHPAQQAGMIDLVSRIAARVHAQGGTLMAQNGDAIIGIFMPYLDAWNREDATLTYDFERKRYELSDADGRRSARATLRAMHSAGIVTTTTDYYGSPTAPAAKRAIRISCKAGAIPLVANISLTAVPARPQRCP